MNYADIKAAFSIAPSTTMTTGFDADYGSFFCRLTVDLGEYEYSVTAWTPTRRQARRAARYAIAQAAVADGWDLQGWANEARADDSQPTKQPQRLTVPRDVESRILAKWGDKIGNAILANAHLGPMAEIDWSAATNKAIDNAIAKTVPMVADKADVEACC